MWRRDRFERPDAGWVENAARTAAALLAFAAIGCGADDADPLPAACNDGARAIQAALAHAPGRVALDGRTPLSTCVERARTGADIQTVGALFTATADALASDVTRSDTAALRLGYLVGAAHRGSARTSGIHEELVRRLENATRLDGATPARRAAYRRGLAAGRRRG